ncbi:MAG TPA: DUF1440 domain-containing protein [Gemmatimonadaceae bacterium]|nr:DUF1440 domain-containing protein [Gemmatimonadaceae bacterium]
MAGARNGGVGAALVDGIVAGALATWAMGKVTTALYARERRDAREREDRARGGTPAYEAAADKLADAAGIALSDDQRPRAGSAIHWALGAVAGATYASLRPHVRTPAAVRGLAFGIAFWLLIDEIATPALGLTPGPAAFPWQTHARALAGHLVFGAAADASLSLLERGQ